MPAKLVIGVLVGVVLVVPFAIFKLLAMPFEKPLTPEDVSALLRECIDGTAEDDEIDNFTSIRIADPQLREVRDEMRALAGDDWNSDETRQKLNELLTRVEAMEAPSSS